MLSQDFMGITFRLRRRLDLPRICVFREFLRTLAEDIGKSEHTNE
jgi:hypothetical protein